MESTLECQFFFHIRLWVFFLSANSSFYSELKTSDVSFPEIEEIEALDLEIVEVDEDLDPEAKNEAASASWAFTVASKAFAEAFKAIVWAFISSVSDSVVAAEKEIIIIYSMQFWFHKIFAFSFSMTTSGKFFR